jgi:hypothetical protein
MLRHRLENYEGFTMYLNEYHDGTDVVVAVPTGEEDPTVRTAPFKDRNVRDVREKIDAYIKKTQKKKMVQTLCYVKDRYGPLIAGVGKVTSETSREYARITWMENFNEPSRRKFEEVEISSLHPVDDNLDKLEKYLGMLAEYQDLKERLAVSHREMREEVEGLELIGYKRQIFTKED